MTSFSISLIFCKTSSVGLANMLIITLLVVLFCLPDKARSQFVEDFLGEWPE